MIRYAARSAAVAVLSVLAGCVAVDGYGDRGGYPGYRTAPQPYWGPSYGGGSGYWGPPRGDHRGGYGQQRAAPAPGPPPRANSAPAYRPPPMQHGGGPRGGGGARREPNRVEQGAD